MVALLRHSISRQITRPHLPSQARFRSTVALASDSYSPSKGVREGAGPVVILHGLYGSKQNWRGLAKGMAENLGRQIWALDLRNHGLSPHAPEATYTDLAADVDAFIAKEGLKDVAVIGHSMGGKVAMALALSPCEQLEKLVVVDIAPGVGAISPEFKSYLDGMKEISSSGCKSRKEADEILLKYEKDLSVRQFLLTNLHRDDPTGPYGFRLPLDYLADAIKEIGEFPYAPGEKKWEGPTLVLKGAKSKYINRKNIPLIKEYFPNMRLETLEAGHWVHAEKPKEFMELVHEFLKA